MADWMDTPPEPLQIRAETRRALIARTEAQLTPILAGIITELREPSMSEGELLWMAINIVESAMTNLQQRARAGLLEVPGQLPEQPAP